MGVVYEAEQVSLGRRVALKVLPRQSLGDGKALERFRREARAAARLHHTNIVPVFGVGEQDGLHYYVMQFIPGQGLDAVLEELRRLRRSRPATGGGLPADDEDRRRSGHSARDMSAAAVARSLLTGRFARLEPEPNPGLGRDAPTADEQSPHPAPPLDQTRTQAPAAAAPQVESDSSVTVPSPGRADLSSLSGSERGYWQGVARVGVQVAEALAYAHGQGVLHRDIKPANLLLDARGDVWVADFGLAKAADGEDLTHTGDMVGTLRYLAPERLGGRSDPRGDVYSLGLTLYELLTLRPAFDATDRERLIQQVTQSEPPRPRQLESGVPRDLETTVLKAIAREPAHRYATAGALAEDLQRFIEGRPILARRVSTTERLWRWCRRNPGIACLSASTAALLVIVAVVSSVMAFRERRAKDDLEESLFFNRIGLAAREMDARNVGRAEELLAECPRRLRGWEWHYLRRIPRERPLVLRGHTGRIAAIAYGHRDERLASIGLDLERLGDNGEVKDWDTTSGREMWTDRINASGVRSEFWALALSRDGRRLAAAELNRSADASCNIKVWDAATGRVVRVLEGHADLVVGLAFSTDGERIVSVDSAGWVRLWDARTGGGVRAFRSDVEPLLSMAYHPDGHRVALGGGDGMVTLWDVTTGRRLLDFRRFGTRPLSLAFNLDGTRLAAGGALGVVKVWDTASGREPFVLPQNPGTMYGVAFVPNAPYLATCSGHGTFRLWDLRSVREALSLHTPVTLWHIDFNPDGRRMAMALGDGTIQIISAAPVEDRAFGPLCEVPHAGPVSTARYSPDGARLATIEADEGPGRPARIRVIDAADGRVFIDVGLMGSRVTAVAFSPDGKHITTVDADGSITVRNVANGLALYTLSKLRATTLAYSPDGRWIVANDEGIGRDTRLVIRDAGTGHMVHSLDAGPSRLNGLAFSPDGRRVAAVGDDSLLRVWDTETGVRLRCARTGLSWVGPLAFSPDGRQIATAGCGEAGVKIWDSATGQLISDLPGHPGHLMCVAYSPDGRLLAAGSADKTVRIWDLATGQESRTLIGHSDWVTDISFSPDGRRLASSSYDGTVKTWDVTGLSLGPVNPPRRGP
jgi:WD40 repeat protein/serine/threonine protein kinase